MVGVANCPLCEVVCYCSGSNRTKISVNVLNFMEIRSEHSELSIISHVSAVEGCPLRGDPLKFSFYTLPYLSKAAIRVDHK